MTLSVPPTNTKKVKRPDSQARNEAVLEDDEEILEISHEEDDEADIEPIQGFNEVEDLELAKALEDAYLTPPPSEDEHSPTSFHVQYPLDQDNVEPTGDGFNAQGVYGATTKDSFDAACDDRFEDFVCEEITSTYQGAFAAGRKFNLLYPSQYEISRSTPLGTILKRLSDLTSNPTNKCGRSTRSTRSTPRDNRFLAPCGYLYTRRISMGSCRSARHA